jgi:threonine synthase
MYDNSPTKLGFVSGLSCLECKHEFGLQDLVNKSQTIHTNMCPNLDGPLDVRYDFEALSSLLTPREIEQRFRNNPSYFMLKELLPLDTIRVEDAPVTPLRRAHGIEAFLKEKYGVQLQVYLKLDAANETGSFKDRPTKMAYNRALEDGSYNRVVTASTGNLGVSTLALAKKHGFGAAMFVPSSLGQNKLKAMSDLCSVDGESTVAKDKWKNRATRKAAVARYAEDAYSFKDRKIVPFDGVYDDANRFAHEVAEAVNEFSVAQTGRRVCFIPNDTHRPFYKEGSKTTGYEIALQLLHDHGVAAEEVKVIFPIGSGALACSAMKGIAELRRLGAIQSHYRLYAAQGEGCAPVVEALLRGENNPMPWRPEEVKTIAKSIAIYNPGSGAQTIDVVRSTHGSGIKVPERDIFEGVLSLHEREGIFSQFVGGVSVGAIAEGIKKGDFHNGDVIVANITGSGKDRIEDELPLLGMQFCLEERAERLLRAVK